MADQTTALCMLILISFMACARFSCGFSFPSHLNGPARSVIFYRHGTRKLGAQKSRRMNASLLTRRHGCSQQQNDASTKSLLSFAINRARRTLTDKATLETTPLQSDAATYQDTTARDPPSEGKGDDSYNGMASELLQLATQQIQREGSTDTEYHPRDNANKKSLSPSHSYGKNPTITTTALAHELWSHVIRPGVDSAIDATAGNGGDSVVLSQLLFPPPSSSSQQSMPGNDDDEDDEIDSSKADSQQPSSQSHLYCVDVQPEACANTQKELSKALPQHIMDHRVHICCASHAPLPKQVHSLSSVALVAYNLGFLPGADREGCRPMQTQTQSTLASMSEAISLLRVGGLLSVVTYPRSNRQEAEMVRVFLEGLALFSSVTHDWKIFVDQHPFSALSGLATVDDEEEQEYVQDLRRTVQQSLQRIRDEGPVNQTWRVHQHEKLGWVDAPILLTATRIK